MANITFDELLVVIGVIVGVFTFIVLTFNVSKALREWRHIRNEPINRLEEQVGQIQPQIVPNLGERLQHIEERLAVHDEKLNADWEFQRDEAEFNKLMLKSIKQLLQHEIDDNDKQGLIDMEKEIDEFLLKRAQ